MRYDPRFRPQQPATPAADAFTIHRAQVDGDLSLAYVREGVGGQPLLLLHGYPETKRIWWRNILPLVEAGFEVIVPDLRGYGDSDLSPTDAYDLALYSRDLYTLVHDVLGHETCLVAGGDVGGAVAVDMTNRYPGFVTKLCFFNTVPPVAIDAYTAAGLDFRNFSANSTGPTGDYRLLQGRARRSSTPCSPTTRPAGSGWHRCTCRAFGPHRARSARPTSTS